MLINFFIIGFNFHKALNYDIEVFILWYLSIIKFMEFNNINKILIKNINFFNLFISLNFIKNKSHNKIIFRYF